MIVVNYLKKHGSITQPQATLYLSITRLSAVIHRLRKKGWKIPSELIKGLYLGNQSSYRLDLNYTTTFQLHLNLGE